MDLTTDNLEALTLNVESGTCDSSDSDDDGVEASDAMLGTLERGLNTISTHARQYMNTCTTDENRKDMQGRLETSMLSLLRSEQVVKEIPMIVTSVVDDFVTEMEQEEEKEDQDQIDKAEDERPLHRFRPMHKKNEENMDKMSQKLFKLFQEKVDDFEHSLTEHKLKQLPKFTALEKEVALSLDEFEAKINEKAMAIAIGAGDALPQDGNDDEIIKFHDTDDLSDDESILPSIDPITKKPMNPVRNKFCNHVFEEKSVFHYINTNPNPVCPLDYCRNERIFEKDHFVKIPKLTEQIRRKNLKDRN